MKRQNVPRAASQSSRLYNSPALTRRITHIVLASTEFGPPMIAGTGKPPERIKLARLLCKDDAHPGLLEEAKKGQMDIEYMPGEELQTLFRKIMDQLRDLLDRVKKFSPSS